MADIRTFPKTSEVNTSPTGGTLAIEETPPLVRCDIQRPSPPTVIPPAVPSTGLITTNAVADMDEGGVITLDDGTHEPVTFELDTDGIFSPERIPVPVLATDTAAQLATKLAAAINILDFLFLGISASAVGSTVTLTNDVAGADGNQPQSSGVNDGKKATGSIVAIASSLLSDGETFTLRDGVNPSTTYEFNKGGGYRPVTPGNVPVNLGLADASAAVATFIAAAINEQKQPVLLVASVVGSTVNLVAVNRGTTPNLTIIDTVANAGFILTGMSGGTPSIFAVTAMTGGKDPGSAVLTPVVTGGYPREPKSPFSTQVMKVDSYCDNELVGCKWTYHKLGGNGSFMAVHYGRIPNLDDLIQEDAQFGLQVQLAGETTYTQWYKGVIERGRHIRAGNEEFTIIEGTGCLIYLNRVIVQRSYAHMTVRDIVKDIIGSLVEPQSRVIYDETLITAGDYVVRNFNPHTTALRAIKTLAELEGVNSVAWGVGADRKFFFVPQDVSVQHVLFTEKDLVDPEVATYFEGANKLKIEGEDFGTHCLLQEEEDRATIDVRGMREEYVQMHMLGHPDDVTRWAQNILSKRKNVRFWRRVKQALVDKQVFSNPALGEFRVHDQDETTSPQVYPLGKVVYSHGGKRASQVKLNWEGQGVDFNTRHQLRAEYFLGRWGRDIVEEIELIDARVDHVRAHNAQRRDNLVHVGLLPVGAVGNVGPVNKVVNIHLVRSFQDTFDMSMAFRGETKDLSTEKGLEMAIRIKYSLSKALIASSIELLVKWAFVQEGVSYNLQYNSRRIIIDGQVNPPVKSDTPKFYDGVFILNGEYKVNSEVVVVIERAGDTGFMDSFDGDFDVTEVEMFLKKQIHPPRANYGRVNVSREPAQSPTL